MADSTIQLDKGVNGKILDTESVVVGANTVERQRQEIAGAGALEIARVKNVDPVATDYGLAVRQIPAAIVVSSNVPGAGNSTILPLAAGASFTGIWEDIRGFAELDINLAGAPSVAPGTMFFEFSPDNGTHVDVSVPLSVTGPGAVPLPLRTVLPYFRMRYVNGAIAQTELRLTIVYHYQTAARLTRFIDQTVGALEPVEMVGAIIVGQDAANVRLLNDGVMYTTRSLLE